MPDEYLYLKLSDGNLMEIFWSDNQPADDRTATGVISINIYDCNGNDLDGGELDVQNQNFDLRAHVQDIFDFMDMTPSEYEEVSEDDIYNIIHQ